MKKQFAARVARAEDGEGLVPEGAVVDEVRHVEAEAVNAVGLSVGIGAEATEPVVVDLHHRGAQFGAGVIELGGVGPVGIEHGAAIFAADIVFGVGAHPDVVARGVVGRDVKNDFQLQFVGAAHERAEFLRGAVFRLHVHEIARGVGRADSLAAEVSDGIGREQIDHVEAEPPQAREVFGQIGQRRIAQGFFDQRFNGVARLARGQRAQIDLVNDGTCQPGGLSLHGRASYLPRVREASRRGGRGG